MTTPAKTVPPGRSLVEVARAIADQRVGALPVVDEAQQPLGIVSYVDVLRALTA